MLWYGTFLHASRIYTGITLRTDQHVLEWILSLADSLVPVARWRLRLSEYDYEIEYQLGTTKKGADGLGRLRRSEEEQELVNDEVSCFVTKDSPNGDETQPRHRKGVLVFCGNAEAETRTENTASSTALDIDKEPVTPDLFTLEEFLQFQREKRL